MADGLAIMKKKGKERILWKRKEKRENLDYKIREQIQQVNQELESLRAAANTDYSVDDENVKDILDEAEADLDNIKSCISLVEDALEELLELKESRESLDDDFEEQEEERQRRYREEEEREEFENYVAYQNRYFKF